MQKLYIFLFSALLALPVMSQSSKDTYKELRQAASVFFRNYKLQGYHPRETMRLDSMRVSEEERSLTMYANEAFCSQPFTPQSVKHIITDLGRALPPPYNTYSLTVFSGKGKNIESLVPNMLRQGEADATRLWGDTEYSGNPWVKNISKPYEPTKGLADRHLMINASHGRYYGGGEWRWQRPELFCTTEDLFTQSFVFPYLIPMLENAGAVVSTARERDAQTAEAVVDNDAPSHQGSYTESSQPDCQWTAAGADYGFAPPVSLLNDSVQPFRSGTARQATTTTRNSRLSQATWTPRIPRTGKYAVYVSYTSQPNSVSDARYTVYHKGGRTQFRINQRMGGGTWVYLGTFTFDEGENREGRVVLSNHSDYRGVVTADGVRFGGGVGQTERGHAGTSGLPRRLEGARYYAQWAGLPDTLFNTEGGTNDYNDDIRSRSLMTNYFGGGSVYQPGTRGEGVPFELSLAVHSDAGIRHDGAVYGTLGICTTTDSEGHTDYVSGLSRQASSDFASSLIRSAVEDLSRKYGIQWTQRELWDRNYGESRTPNVPAAILETMSHQNFGDMKYGHDPEFKFALSRAIYKAILKYVRFEHGKRDYAVQPLPPHRFSAELTAEGNALLRWKATADSTEETAAPTGYVVYTKVGSEDFDNGRLVEGGATSFEMPVSEGLIYSFQVTAVNRGGESFPSETLSIYRAPGAKKKILIVNGFDRLSGPARIERNDSLGFDLNDDIGVARGETMAFCGPQLNFAAREAGREGPDGLGYSTEELAGAIIAGNTFDYPLLHGQSLAKAGGCSFSSVSREAFEEGDADASAFSMIDYIAGLQRDADYNFKSYKVFTPAVRQLLERYVSGGGRVLVSGSFIGSDLSTAEERNFAARVLHYAPAGTARADSTDFVNGLNLRIPIRRAHSVADFLGEKSLPEADGRRMYMLQAPDAIVPVQPGSDTSLSTFTAFAYGGGASAGVAWRGNKARVIAMGFPFESISGTEIREQVMKALVNFLTE